MGTYTVILRRTLDHEDLCEVLCRVVGRWVGQGGKASLANSADADILEYILAKLAGRIAAKSRTARIAAKSRSPTDLQSHAFLAVTRPRPHCSDPARSLTALQPHAFLTVPRPRSRRSTRPARPRIQPRRTPWAPILSQNLSQKFTLALRACVTTPLLQRDVRLSRKMTHFLWQLLAR
jgi:hypothetical protein